MPYCTKCGNLNYEMDSRHLCPSCISKIPYNTTPVSASYSAPSYSYQSTTTHVNQPTQIRCSFCSSYTCAGGCRTTTTQVSYSQPGYQQTYTRCSFCSSIYCTGGCRITVQQQIDPYYASNPMFGGTPQLMEMMLLQAMMNGGGSPIINPGKMVRTGKTSGGHKAGAGKYYTNGTDTFKKY